MATAVSPITLRMRTFLSFDWQLLMSKSPSSSGCSSNSPPKSSVIFWVDTEFFAARAGVRLSFAVCFQAFFDSPSGPPSKRWPSKILLLLPFSGSISSLKSTGRSSVWALSSGGLFFMIESRIRSGTSAARPVGDARLPADARLLALFAFELFVIAVNDRNACSRFFTGARTTIEERLADWWPLDAPCRHFLEVVCDE